MTQLVNAEWSEPALVRLRSRAAVPWEQCE